MSDYWRKKEYIEGEYEVLEERDLNEEQYRPPPRQVLQVDNRPPYVTYALLGLNLAAFLLMSLFGLFFGLNQSEQLLLFGAKWNILIAYGQYWRLLTAMFLHVGITHLFFNSYALYIYGPIVESLFGKAKFIIVYLISGLMGSLLSYMFSPNPAAGASGAIFGLMGSLLYFRQRKKDIFRRVFGPRLFMIIGINLFFGFANAGIDNWGHIGGLIGGYLVGNALGLNREKMLEPRKLLIWALVLLVFIFGLRYGQGKYTLDTQPILPNRGDTVQTNPKAIGTCRIKTKCVLQNLYGSINYEQQLLLQMITKPYCIRKDIRGI